MTTVTYDVMIHATVEIDADELIDETAREIIDSRIRINGYGVECHDMDISAE